MIDDRPVGSITGQQEWGWNEWQDEQQSRGAPRASVGHRPHDHRGCRARCEKRERQRKIEALNDELDRKERRLQYVIDHYERLLTKRNRELNDQRSSESTQQGGSTVLSKVLRYLTNR